MTAKKVKEILEQEGIEEFEKDIRLMTKREIRKYFSFKSNRKINTTKLIKNIIWQSYCWIKAGKMEPVEGNIRSFWYISIKPLLSRLGLDVSNEKYTNNLYDTLSELITKHRLFKYIDFGFLDERIYHRVIGKSNARLILFIEKDGLFPLVREVAEKHEATAISLAGFPSYLTTEYFIRNMAQLGFLEEPVILFGLTDYDPAGYWIISEFRDQLVNYGVEVEETISLMKPELLSAEMIEVAKYKLGKSSRIKNWLAATGGIAGEAYGLEADALGGKRIRKVYTDAIKPYLAKASSKKAKQLAISPERTSWLEWLRQ